MLINTEIILYYRLTMEEVIQKIQREVDEANRKAEEKKKHEVPKEQFVFNKDEL